jgi:ribosome-binding factor A
LSGLPLGDNATPSLPGCLQSLQRKGINMGTERTSRVSELIKREIADILCREMNNPKLGFVTVSDVDVTKDLRSAFVRISVMGDEEHKQESLRCLNAATGFIQRELSSRVRLRYMPKLHFRLDTSLDHSMHISQILAEIKKERETSPDHPHDESDSGKV